VLSAPEGKRDSNSIHPARMQEFYTSPESNIEDATGQDALVSLVGTIGSGLTWSGSIVVSPMLSRSRDPRTVALAGALLMSLGIVLASFATRVSISDVETADSVYIQSFPIALAPLLDPGTFVRSRFFALVLPACRIHTGLFRSP